MSTPLIPVILCGGTGTRLWPLSRASYPKQYWALGGSGDDTLLQQTQQRLEGLEGLLDRLDLPHLLDRLGLLDLEHLLGHLGL